MERKKFPENVKVMCPVCHKPKNPDRAICDNCFTKSCASGHLMSQDSNICHQCGWQEPLKKPAQPHTSDNRDTDASDAQETGLFIVCPRCKIKVDASDGHCPNCGYLGPI